MTRSDWNSAGDVLRTLSQTSDLADRLDTLSRIEQERPALARALARLLVPPKPPAETENRRGAADPSDSTQLTAEERCKRTAISSSSPEPGTLLERRYLVGEQLGRGGFGAVHSGVDTFSNTDVAIKFVALAATRGDQRYQRELAALWQARVPGVVEVLDDGQIEPFAFLIMQRIHGEPFPGTREASNEALGAYEFCERAASLLRSLRHLHASQIVHKDLKPQNALVQPDGSCTLVDLGIAQEEGKGELPSNAEARVGTPRYMAPERLYGAPASVASDYFSAGVMLRDAVVQLELEDWLDNGLLKAIHGLTDQHPERRKAAFTRLSALLHRTPDHAHPPRALTAFDVRSYTPPGNFLSRTAVRQLIDAPARIFRCPERIARCVIHLTLGCPPLVLQLITAWGEAGLGSWVDERFQTSPQQVARILELNNEHLIDRRLKQAPPLSAEAEHTWRALAAQTSRHLPLGSLAGSSEMPPRFEENIDELHIHGLLGRDDHNLIVLWFPSESQEEAKPSARAEELTELLARAMRLHPETRPAANDAERLEALQETATAAARAGNVTEAFRLTTRILTDIRRQALDDAQLYDRALATAAECSLTASHRSAVDIARAHAELHPKRSPSSEAWARLLAAAAKTMQGAPKAACDLLDQQLDSMPTVAHQRLAHIIMNLASMRTKSIRAMEERLRRSARWVRANPTKRHRSLLAAWTGWLRFEREEYERSASLHGRAARLATRRRARFTALMNSANAALEAGHLNEAAERASQVLELADIGADFVNAARAERMLRTVAYRKELDLAPDWDLVLSARELAPGTLKNLMLLGEAAIAWRGQHTRLAVSLCSEVEGRDTSTGLEALATCLKAAAGASQETSAVWMRLKLLPKSVPRGISSQAVALLHSSESAPPCRSLPALVQRAREWAHEATRSSSRREVLSPREVIEILDA